MTHEVMATFPGGGVTLLGYTQPYGQMTLPEGVWPITLFWRAEQDQPSARVREMVLLDGEGHEAGRIPGTAVDGYPFEMWQAGEIVRDPLQFVAASSLDLDVGVYRFGVTVSNEDGPLNPGGASESFVLLGSVEFIEENGE